MKTVECQPSLSSLGSIHPEIDGNPSFRQESPNYLGRFGEQRIPSVANGTEDENQEEGRWENQGDGDTGSCGHERSVGKRDPRKGCCQIEDLR